MKLGSAVWRVQRLTVLAIAVSLVVFGAPTTGEDPVPKLVDVFPRDGMRLAPDSEIITIFSDLMDALSVLASLRVELQPSIAVSIRLEGECGDDTTLTFAPTTGRWQPGYYTLTFNSSVRTASGTEFIPTRSAIHFTVLDSAPIVVSAIVTDSVGLTTVIESGIRTSVRPGPLELGFEFSAEIDLGKFLGMLANQGISSKPRNCQSRAVSLSLSVSVGASISFSLDPTGVVDRTNESRTLDQPFYIALVGVTGAIRGTVTDTAGQPLSGATGVLLNGTGEIARRMTDASGIFIFSSVAEGNYTIRVEAPGFVAVSKPVVVEAGQTAVPTFRLIPADPPDLSWWIIASLVLVAVLILLALGYKYRRPPRPTPTALSGPEGPSDDRD